MRSVSRGSASARDRHKASWTLAFMPPMAPVGPDGEVAGPRHPAVGELVVGHHLVHQPEVTGALGVEGRIAREQLERAGRDRPAG